MNREVRLGMAGVALLGAFVLFMLVVGGLGGTRPDLDPLTVEEVLAGEVAPAARYGRDELHVVGWYAELDADCTADEGGAADDGGRDPAVAWLERDCPLRVLLQAQPPADATQRALERDGLRLAAPMGSAFPSRAEPGGANLRGQPLVFVGHFDDAAAASCVADRVERCRNTFVVSDYDGFVR